MQYRWHQCYTIMQLKNLIKDLKVSLNLRVILIFLKKKFFKEFGNENIKSIKNFLKKNNINIRLKLFMNIVIIDYKMSNLHSVDAACKKVGFNSVISSDPKEILDAKVVILPGVGSFKQAMLNLKNLKLDTCIHDYVQTGKIFRCLSWFTTFIY